MRIDDLLRETTEARASDLHLTAGVKPMMRVWGRLLPLERHDVLSPQDTLHLGLSVLTPFQRQKFEERSDFDLSYAVAGLGRFRINLYRQRGALAIAVRVIPPVIPSLQELHLPSLLRDLTYLPRGLVLITGPSGHGKSTTLASMIDLINAEQSVHIVTIEDPIEYEHSHKKSIVNQREVGFDTQSFPIALRAVLREDPNIVGIGEIRDLETIAAALTIAETGHLVLATVHTPTAGLSVDRIIDVFPPSQQQQVRIQFAAVIEAVISQQLLSNTRYQPGRAEAPPGVRVRGTGLSNGGHDAEMIGLVPAVELMVATPAIRNMIREAKTHQIEGAIQTGSRYGMQTMDQALRDLHLRGFSTFEDAVTRAVHPEDFIQMVREAGGTTKLPSGEGATVTDINRSRQPQRAGR